jgi:hypothetical protein
LINFSVFRYFSLIRQVIIKSNMMVSINEFLPIEMVDMILMDWVLPNGDDNLWSEILAYYIQVHVCKLWKLLVESVMIDLKHRAEIRLWNTSMGFYDRFDKKGERKTFRHHEHVPGVLARVAAKTGNVPILRWLKIEHTLTKPTGRSFFNYTICKRAACGGSVELLEWLVMQCACWGPEVCKGAAKKGHLQVLEWADRKGMITVRSSDAVHENSTFAVMHRIAVRHGSLDTLKFLRSKARSPLKTITCVKDSWAIGLFFRAAKVGSVVMEWLSDNTIMCGCPTCRFSHIPTMCDRACGMGRIDVLDWMWDMWGIYGLAAEPQRCFKFYKKAARGGHLNVIKWLKAKEFLWGRSLCNKAACHPNGLEIIKWARSSIHKYPAPWNTDTTSNACHYGNTDTLIWLVENGCGVELKPTIIINAAIRHHDTRLLQWAMDKKFCTWEVCESPFCGTRYVTSVCLEKRNRTMFEWAVKNGCPISTFETNEAAFMLQLDRLKTLIDGGFPYDVDQLNAKILFAQMAPPRHELELGPVLVYVDGLPPWKELEHPLWKSREWWALPKSKRFVSL